MGEIGSGGFEDWAQARWPVLVGSARSSGASEEDAQRAVVVAMAGARGRWRELRHDVDLDARVLGAALHLLAPERFAAGGVVPPDLSVPPEPGRRGVPLEEVTVLAARDAALRRRRRLRAGVAAATGAAVLVVGVAVGVWLLGPDRPQPDVARGDNQVPAPWWADGRLHLDDVVVDLDGVRAIAEDGEDVVFEDAEGFGRVAADGTVEWSDDEPAALSDRDRSAVSGYRLLPPEDSPLGVIEVLDAQDRIATFAFGRDRRVLQASLRTGGVVVAVVRYSPASVELRDYRRASETGPVLVVACDLQTRACRRAATVIASDTVLLPP